MAFLLLIAFIAVPLVEIGVFIQVGGLIGLWPTLAVVVLTAIIGTWLLRQQGLATLGRARAQMDQGVLPTRELFDGICLLFAGALLLTPGFVTDTVGFLLFVPPLRDALRVALARHFQTSGQTRVWVQGEEVYRGPKERPGAGNRGPGGGTRRGGVIDGDFRDVTPEGSDGDEDPQGNDPRRPLPR